MVDSTNNHLADQVLQLEQQFLSDDVRRASQEIDHLVRLFQNIGFRRTTLRSQINLLNRILFRDRGLRFSAATPSRNFTLTGTLLDGYGNCLGLSMVYMVVADKLDIPTRPILYEGHVAVCFEVEGEYYPVEVSRGGAVLLGRLAELMYSGKGDGRVLTNVQLLAVHMSNQAAFVYAPKHDYAFARSLLECAVQQFPDYTAAWINMAALCIRLNELDRAVEALDRVMNLTPSGTYLRHALEMMEHLLRGRPFSLLHIA